MDEVKWRCLYLPFDAFLKSLFDKFHLKYTTNNGGKLTYVLSSKERFDYIWNACNSRDGIVTEY